MKNMNIDITIILNINYEIQFYFTKSCIVVVLGNRSINSCHISNALI